MLKNWDVSGAIDFKLIVWDLFLVLVLESWSHIAFFNHIINLEHWLFSVVDYILDLFSLLLILMFGPGRSTQVGDWIVLEKFRVHFHHWDQFHDFLVLCRNVRVKCLLILGIYLGWFGIFIFLIWLGRKIEFGLVD